MAEDVLRLKNQGTMKPSRCPDYGSTKFGYFTFGRNASGRVILLILHPM